MLVYKLRQAFKDSDSVGIIMILNRCFQLAGVNSVVTTVGFSVLNFWTEKE